MLPTEEEMEVDTCGDKCCAGFYKAWNSIACLIWGGFCAGFIMFRRPQMVREECPMPWDIFFVLDTGWLFLYYLTALISQCCEDSEGDVPKAAQKLQMCRMCFCIPCSFCFWVVLGIFGALNWKCFEYKAAPPRSWPFQFTVLGYMAIRMFQQCATWLIVCLQCCALNTFRKQEIVKEISGVDENMQAVAANRSVQRWSIIVGIKPLSTDQLVGFGAAEEYRRRKRDLEEGYKVYRKQKKGKKKFTVKHVKTKVEVAEEKAAAALEGHEPVFPFMRMTKVVRQNDVKLENPFAHMANGPSDLAAANKAAVVVAQAAASVAKRSGAHMVGVPARRNL